MSVRPCAASAARTSSIDLRPKFGIATSSLSDFDVRSPIVSMPTRFRQLYERTPSSSSSIGKFSIPCVDGRLGRRLRAPPRRSPRSRSRSVKIASWRMRISAACADRVARVDRAVGGDVEDELVVVRALADARGLDLVRDAADRREDRVDRDHADRRLRAAVELGRHVAAAAADRERHLELALVGDVGDLELRVEDLEVGGRLDVGGRDDARALLRDVDLDLGRRAVEQHDEVLEVEDDVGDVLADAGKRRELVGDALDLHGGHGRALERGEQHAAQRVAERVAEAAVERLDREDAAVVVGLLVDDPRDLELHQAGSSSQVDPFAWSWQQGEAGSSALLRVELDDERFLDGRVDLVALRAT